MAGSFPHVSNGNAQPKMNRRTFITASTAAAIGFGANSILTANAQEKEPMDTSTQPFWPDKARLVISISMQFETGAQPDRGAGSPFPPIDPKYPDLPVQKWYEYGFKEGIPRMLDMWDRVGVKVTSHMVGIVDRGHEAAGHGQTWEPQYSMTPEQERAGYQASIDTIQKATGTRPIGFNAFWLRGTPNTLLDVVEESAPNLQHVTIYQGGKAYGSDLGPFKTPAREDDPRLMPPNFYYDQEDHLRQRQQGKRWTFGILRPEAVCGYAVGNPMNLLTVIAVYAAISKELGLPLRFPGTGGGLPRALSDHFGRYPRPCHRLGGRDKGGGERNLQHHQWRLFPLAIHVAPHRPDVRDGGGRTRADALGHLYG